MTWEELKEEAKKMGCEDGVDPIHDSFILDTFVFYKGGWIYVVNNGEESLLSSGRTNDDMLAIMKALQ